MTQQPVVKQAPTLYIVKQGAATVTELSALSRTDPASVATLKAWADEEQAYLGIK